jgi:hypothetical protein
MTRPTDAAIARAFFEIAHQDGYVREAVLKRAAEFDAESPDGAGDEICDCGYVRGSFGCDDTHKNTRKVTTPPERVQIPAESEHAAPYDRCPACTAHMPVGQTCGGVNCGLKPA